MLTAVVALMIDLGVELSPEIGALLDPAAFAISAILVYWLPNGPRASDMPDAPAGAGE